MSCAIGLRAHSGWAVVVAVAVADAPGAASPAVVLRERIELADPSIPGSKAPYHAAEKLELEPAARYLERCEAASRARAETALDGILSRLRGEGRPAARCALLLSAARPLPGLAATLASHAWIHVGDGEHFRSALSRAAERWGLAAEPIREREIVASLAARLGQTAAFVDAFLEREGRRLGPPWAADQKRAALAAWYALSGAGGA